MTDEKYSALTKLSIGALCDAMEMLGHPSSVCRGIFPAWRGCAKVVGKAVTVQLGPIGQTRTDGRLYETACSNARPGDILVIDNNGYTDTSCFDDKDANYVRNAGFAGVIVDGAVRNVENICATSIPVYSKGIAVRNGKKNLMEYGNAQMLSFAVAQVCPDDIVVGTESGVLFLPETLLEQIIEVATHLEEEAL